jgi:hypothetical protein
MTPTVMPVTTTPPTSPRRAGGTRSGTQAVTAAITAFRPACAPAQNRHSARTDSAVESSNRNPQATSAPIRIQGVRLPHRELVRSDRAPASRFTTIATTTPMVPARDRAPSLPCSPATSSDCSGSSWFNVAKIAVFRPTFTSATEATQPGRVGCW